MIFLISKARSILLSTFVLLCTTQVMAQEIKSATFTSAQSSMGSSVELTITFQTTGNPPWCGLLVEWGDGEKQNVRVGEDNFKTSPITLTHKYATAGNFNATVKGNTMVRGLKTAQACGGVVKPAQINIVDTVALQQAEARRLAAEREKAALEEAERVKKAALEEADRAKKAALEQADRARKAIESKELELKRKELEMKEEMLKREEDLRKREEEARKRSQQRPPVQPPAPSSSPAPAPAPTPAPTPAPAGTKPGVKPASGF
jgi:flagellar biosynthesis GTPase FlhF